MQYLMTKEELDCAIDAAEVVARRNARNDLAITIRHQLEGCGIVNNGATGPERELVDAVSRIMQKLVEEGKRAELWKRKAEEYALKEANS